MDILTFLGLDYRVALLITLYFVVPGINFIELIEFFVLRSREGFRLLFKLIPIPSNILIDRLTIIKSDRNTYGPTISKGAIQSLHEY